MITEFKSINKIALFNTLNQWAEELTWFWCTLFAPAINLKYNCGIELTIEDLKIIWNRQIARGKLDPDSWGKGSDWVNAIYEYIIENHEEREWKIPNLVKFKQFDTPELMKWIDRGYMAMIWIWVNKAFVKDAMWDGILDLFEDYVNYKWNDLWHFTNITRWKCRFDSDGCSDYWKEQFIDSYAWNKRGNKWIYKCDIKEVIEDIAMTTKYIFY